MTPNTRNGATLRNIMMNGRYCVALVMPNLKYAGSVTLHMHSPMQAQAIDAASVASSC